MDRCRGGGVTDCVFFSTTINGTWVYNANDDLGRLYETLPNLFFLKTSFAILINTSIVHLYFFFFDYLRRWSRYGRYHEYIGPVWRGPVAKQRRINKGDVLFYLLPCFRVYSFAFTRG